MNILVTGANGFVGRSLVTALNYIREGKDRSRKSLNVDDVYTYDTGSSLRELDEACACADFIYNFSGSRDSTLLLKTLIRHKNTCPIVLGGSHECGESIREYSRRTGVRLYERDPGADMEQPSVESIVDEMIDALQIA